MCLLFLLKQFNKAKYGGQILGIWGNFKWKNAYRLRIKKYFMEYNKRKNIYTIKTWKLVIALAITKRNL